MSANPPIVLPRASPPLSPNTRIRAFVLSQVPHQARYAADGEAQLSTALTLDRAASSSHAPGPPATKRRGIVASMRSRGESSSSSGKGKNEMDGLGRAKERGGSPLLEPRVKKEGAHARKENAMLLDRGKEKGKGKGGGYVSEADAKQAQAHSTAAATSKPKLPSSKRKYPEPEPEPELDQETAEHTERLRARRELRRTRASIKKPEETRLTPPSKKKAKRSKPGDGDDAPAPPKAVKALVGASTLMQNFTAKNVREGGRLTLKRGPTLGMFNKGKASERVEVGAGRARAAPDFVFDETRFLNRRSSLAPPAPPSTKPSKRPPRPRAKAAPSPSSSQSPDDDEEPSFRPPAHAERSQPALDDYNGYDAYDLVFIPPRRKSNSDCQQATTSKPKRRRVRDPSPDLRNERGDGPTPVTSKRRRWKRERDPSPEPEPEPYPDLGSSVPSEGDADEVEDVAAPPRGARTSSAVVEEEREPSEERADEEDEEDAEPAPSVVLDVAGRRWGAPAQGAEGRRRKEKEKEKARGSRDVAESRHFAAQPSRSPPAAPPSPPPQGDPCAPRLFHDSPPAAAPQPRYPSASSSARPVPAARHTSRPLPATDHPAPHDSDPLRARSSSSSSDLGRLIHACAEEGGPAAASQLYQLQPSAPSCAFRAPRALASELVREPELEADPARARSSSSSSDLGRLIRACEEAGVGGARWTGGSVGYEAEGGGGAEGYGEEDNERQGAFWADEPDGGMDVEDGWADAHAAAADGCAPMDGVDEIVQDPDPDDAFPPVHDVRAFSFPLTLPEAPPAPNDLGAIVGDAEFPAENARTFSVPLPDAPQFLYFPTAPAAPDADADTPFSHEYVVKDQDDEEDGDEDVFLPALPADAERAPSSPPPADAYLVALPPHELERDDYPTPPPHARYPAPTAVLSLFRLSPAYNDDDDDNEALDVGEEEMDSYRHAPASPPAFAHRFSEGRDLLLRARGVREEWEYA